MEQSAALIIERGGRATVVVSDIRDPEAVQALLVGAQASIRAMREVGNTGHIVNASSVAALRPMP